MYVLIMNYRSVRLISTIYPPKLAAPATASTTASVIPPLSLAAVGKRRNPTTLRNENVGIVGRRGWESRLSDMKPEKRKRIKENTHFADFDHYF